jgi:hypothetical protein
MKILASFSQAVVERLKARNLSQEQGLGSEDGFIALLQSRCFGEAATTKL